MSPEPHLLDASMFWSPQGTGGVHRYVEAKRAHLQAQGWRHTLLAPGVDGAGRVDCGGLSLPKSGGYRFVLNRPRAAALMRAQRPDVIEAADPFVLGWSALDAGQRLGVPTVAFCHSNLPVQLALLAGGPGEGWRARAVARWARDYLVRLYAHYDLVLAPSATMTRQLHDWGIAQALHQPLGVDCAVFRPQARDLAWRRRLERLLSIGRGTRLLLYCGRFAPEKRLDLLADAAKALGDDYLLLAIGSGPCPPRGRQVRVLPPEHDDARLARLMASCDAFVHAGNTETFGLSLLEAMACGTPVFVSAAAGLGELAEGAGQLIASPRPADWAEAIATGLAGNTLPRVDRALRRARSMDWAPVFERLGGRYRRLMQGLAPDGAAADQLVPRVA